MVAGQQCDRSEGFAEVEDEAEGVGGEERGEGRGDDGEKGED